jgi:hypothetical protein
MLAEIINSGSMRVDIINSGNSSGSMPVDIINSGNSSGSDINAGGNYKQRQ